ncbi:MAG: hypothetical protein GY946_23300 [bacterium]|nr:hypothetical protein [bacterium]
MNITVGGIEDRSPPHMLDVMHDPECENLVWLSPEVCRSSTARFCWIYSHELQHLIQCANDPVLSAVGSFLESNRRRILPASQVAVELPAELDAEICAKRVICRLLGVETCRDFIDSERMKPNGALYFDRLASLELTWTGDLKTETQRFIRQCENAVRREYDANYNQYFSFDLDADKSYKPPFTRSSLYQQDSPAVKSPDSWPGNRRNPGFSCR